MTPNEVSPGNDGNKISWKDDSPLDVSPEFVKLCSAARINDLKACQEAIYSGVNINARDAFDYTPLILASLCGHYEVVRLLLESGAVCDRKSFQGERCLHNALTVRIHKLLLQYDYSKSTNPLQPFANHIRSLIAQPNPKTWDIRLSAGSLSWELHKFVLSARSPYFAKLSEAPEITTWKLPDNFPPEVFNIALRYLYLGDPLSDIDLNTEQSVAKDKLFRGLEEVSKLFDIKSLWDGISSLEMRIVRQRYEDEVSRGRKQIDTWYRDNILKHSFHVETDDIDNIRWTIENEVFADVLLRADPPEDSEAAAEIKTWQKCLIFPAHRAMLVRAKYFRTMFTSQFQEAQMGEHLKIIPVYCSPEVLQIVLDFLYTETADIPLSLAVDVLYAADMLFFEKLKTKAAVVIATIGSGNTSMVDRTHIDGNEVEIEPINVYDVMRAAWDMKIQRLEEFCARYLAYRLEDYIDEEDFEVLIKESASRIQKRQETDTIEVLDDIRYYLGERFRLAFEDAGLDNMMEESDKSEESRSQLDGDSDDETEDRAPLAIANTAVESQHRPSNFKKVGSQRKPVDSGRAAAEVFLQPNNELDAPSNNAAIRTLDGALAVDEFAADAVNSRVLLGKIDLLLERLRLDA